MHVDTGDKGVHKAQHLNRLVTRGYVESQKNKKLGEACRAKTKLFILLRLNMAAYIVQLLSP